MDNYISPGEIDGAVNPLLLKTVNRFIRALKAVFHIHCMTKGQHSKDSYHYKGLAVDGHAGKFDLLRKPTDIDIQIMAGNLQDLINKEQKTLFEQACLARIAGFAGIGMYVHWQPVGGLHLDLRDSRPLRKTVFWIGLNKQRLQQEIDRTTGDQVYIYV